MFSLALWEGHGLRTCGNGILRRILRSKMQNVRGDWRKLYNKEIRETYTSPKEP
jgi:hypothetical protein